MADPHTVQFMPDLFSSISFLLLDQAAYQFCCCLHAVGLFGEIFLWQILVNSVLKYLVALEKLNSIFWIFSIGI